MLLFPNCKINIGLNVVSRRSDGYHDIETVFYPIYKLHDAIEILPQAAINLTPVLEHAEADEESLQSIHHSPSNIHPSLPVRLHLSGLPINGDSENNLSVKAYHLLKQDFPELPPVDLCLHKAIPMGAGLGGGSADGAFTLQLINQKFLLNLSLQQLLDYALQLGSDCPFFILNKPCFAWGRGEMLEIIPLNLSGYSLVIIHPGIHISTAQAFAGITPGKPANNLLEMILQPVDIWRECVQNDFEKVVFAQHPLLQQIKTRLYETGAVYASMSGSGSTVYGIYKFELLPEEKLYPEFFERHLVL